MNSSRLSESSGSLSLVSPLPPASDSSPSVSASSAISSPASSGNKALTAADRLTLLLREYEKAQDAALHLGAQLTGAVIEAQNEQKLAPSVSQAAIEAFGRGYGSLVDARGRTIDGHKALEAIQRLFRIEVTDFGDGYKYPSAVATLRDSARVAA